MKPFSHETGIQKLDILHDIELPLLKILSDMEMRGIRIDRDFLK